MKNWLIHLLVRFLRMPRVRAALLRHTTRPATGQSRRWQTASPALGSRCVPGCVDGMLDWDGAHYCMVSVGTVPLPEAPGSPVDARIEITQTQDEDGTLSPRQVWLVPTDEDGHACDPMLIDRATVGALVELFDTAFVVAEQRVDRLRPAPLREALSIVGHAVEQAGDRLWPPVVDALQLGATLDDIAEAVAEEPAWIAQRLLCWADGRERLGRMPEEEGDALRERLHAAGGPAPVPEGAR